MRETTFFRALGKTMFVVGVFEFLRYIPSNVVKGVVILLVCLIGTVIAFGVSYRLENLKPKPVRVDKEDNKYKNNR